MIAPSRAAVSCGAGRCRRPGRRRRCAGTGRGGCSASGRPVAGGDVERVEAHPGGAELHDGAADAFGEAHVLVFGVDDGDVHAVVEVAQDVEFGEVGLPGAGAGQDDRVVVVLRHRSHDDHPGGGQVNPVEDPADRRRVAGQRRGQVGGGERERRGQGVGVQGAVHPQAVDPERQGGGPALQVPVGGRLQVQQHRRGGGPDLRAGFGERVLGGGVHGDVHAGAEQFRGAAGDPVGEIGGVLGGGVDARVAETAFVRVDRGVTIRVGPGCGAAARRRRRW